MDTGSFSHVLERLSDSGSAVADIETNNPHVHTDNICHVLEHATNSLGAVGNSANTFFNAACDSSKALSHIASEEVNLVNRRKRSRAHSGSRAVIHALKNLVQASYLATCGLSEVPALVDGVRDTASHSPESSRNGSESALNAAREVLTHEVGNVSEVNAHSGTNTLGRSCDVAL